MDKKERFKYVNYQIAFLTQLAKQVQDETNIKKHISEKIRAYEKESKQLANDLMSFKYKSRVKRIYKK